MVAGLEEHVNAVAEYRAASQGRDIDRLIAALAPDAELVSPLSGRLIFRGCGDLRVLLGAVYDTVGDLRWHDEIGGEGPRRVLMGSCRVAGLELTDAMLLELGPDGTIRRIQPHLRPWLALTVFALRLAPRLARHPAVVWRAAVRRRPYPPNRDRSARTLST